ncbi:MAG: hypothetical protein EP330_16365 [Deltaproteobacteria bacterium]|nr:MAG: hypothetical protein EP330_16365 [Deltaproteobacteria bacterium]
MPRTLFSIITMGMALLFVASAALQLNDPDPVLWTLYYLAAAGVSAAQVKWVDVRPPAVLAGVAVLWLAVLVAGGLPDEPHPMKYGPQSGWLADEVVREGGGLAIVLTWMLVLVGHARSDGSSPTPS